MEGKIILKDFQSDWNKAFKKESENIKKILGKNCVDTVHIGSTAVKGMKSRDVVDILVLVKDIFQVDECNDALENQGYELQESYGPAGRYLYVKKAAVLGYQLHFYEHQDYDDIQKIVAFRDYLEARPEQARAYIALKENYTEDTQNEVSYADAKAAFIRNICGEAIVWHERQHKKDLSMTLGIFLGILMGALVYFVSSSIIMGLGAGVAFALVVFGAFYSSMKKKKE